MRRSRWQGLECIITELDISASIHLRIAELVVRRKVDPAALRTPGKMTTATPNTLTKHPEEHLQLS
jgi:hypothetical protein